MEMSKSESESESVGIEYWLKWQVPVCALVMLIPCYIAIRLIINNSSKPNHHHHHHHHHRRHLLWVPCWSGLNPKWLLLYRASAFVAMAFLLYQMFLFAGLFAFYFYTQWTFALVMLYFAVGTLISAQGCFGSTTHKPPTQSEEEPGTGFLGSLFLVLYQTCAGASILTDLVFWCILMPMLKGKEFELTLLIGCIHSLNLVFLAIDSLMNALPFQWFGFNFFIIWTVTYAVFQWVLHACCLTWWPYPFLELSTPWAPLWYLGIAVVHVPCYGLYMAFVKAKNTILSKVFPRGFLRSHGGLLQQKKSA